MADEPDPNKFYKWTVELQVSATCVADGFDLTDERAHSMLQQHLPYAYPGELKACVIAAPDADEVAKEMGYKSAADPRKKRHDRT